MKAAASMLNAMRRAGREARQRAVDLLIADPGAVSQLPAMMHSAGSALAKALQPLCNASEDGEKRRQGEEETRIGTRHIRAALIDDIDPVLQSLRSLIETPTRESLLSLSVNLTTIEAEVLDNRFSDTAWESFLAAAFIDGLSRSEGVRFAASQPARFSSSRITAANAISFTPGVGISSALRNAAERGILPTHLDTAGLRDLDSSLRTSSFFSARTTSAGYVSELKKLVERHIQGEGYNNDLPQLRVEARELLQAYGYTPEKGFPGDAALGVPSAEPGTLRDLASERRLNLIFNTQAALMRGLGQKLRGLDRIDSFPCWELIRVVPKKAPRDWPNRWIEGGASLVGGSAVTGASGPETPGRMIAPKDAEIWSVLGDSAIFNDALDVDHPPFAFESGMGWREVSFSEATALGMIIRPQEPGQQVNNAAHESAPRTPPADTFIGGQATLDKLEARLREIQKSNPLSMESILAASRSANS